jgi:hypothetical protein
MLGRVLAWKFRKVFNVFQACKVFKKFNQVKLQSRENQRNPSSQKGLVPREVKQGEKHH